ncbi:MAG: type II toxin-antitoxin system RelE/ParE family toxin [Hyphomicrobium sp.]|jgi:toxin ParE1/3/4|uniref:type II toxin-antitoxin system RelE/ParE family toxin n=1 Tax=Hyphomicrobium sp. TaxID=82 RepID=UPI0025BE9169|nr:type II toxin-antitoxin system RelE/ParE family toxin [Hyphomicrobium sp.]MBX9862246.1 type II toxin-antitoxin system RelE/ParE family toxin [Hyphomicrobium sp.]
MPKRGREFRLRPKARADLEGIWLYTAEHWSPAQADIYHSKIVDVMAALASGSLRGRSAGHVRAGYLKYAAGSHLVFFKETDFGIDVIRILHQRMDVETHL